MKKPRRATSGQGVPAMRLIKPPPVGNTFTFRAATTHTHTLIPVNQLEAHQTARAQLLSRPQVCFLPLFWIQKRLA